MKSLKAAIAGTEIPIYISRVRYLDWQQYDENDKGNLIAMCLRKADGYRGEDEVRLVFWAAQLEPVREPAAQAEVGDPFDVERVAQGVMAELAALFPSADFAGVNGRLLVVEAWLKYRQGLRLQHADRGKRVLVDVATLIDEVVTGPKAESWILELARAVVKHYGLSVKVRPSELSAPRRDVNRPRITVPLSAWHTHLATGTRPLPSWPKRPSRRPDPAYPATPSPASWTRAERVL